MVYFWWCCSSQTNCCCRQRFSYLFYLFPFSLVTRVVFSSKFFFILFNFTLLQLIENEIYRMNYGKLISFLVIWECACVSVESILHAGVKYSTFYNMTFILIFCENLMFKRVFSFTIFRNTMERRREKNKILNSLECPTFLRNECFSSFYMKKYFISHFLLIGLYCIL